MLSLEESAILVLIKENKKTILDHEQRYIDERNDLLNKNKDLRIKLSEVKKKKFEQKYGISCNEVLNKYSKKVYENTTLGGYGYEIWLPELLKDNYCRVVTNIYACMPTKMDEEAYEIIYGREMFIPDHKVYRKSDGGYSN